MRGDAETAEESIDCFVGAYAEEKVFGREGARGVVVSVAQLAEEGLEGVLMWIGVTVQTEEVKGGVAGCGGGEGRTVGIFVGVEEDIGSVVFVVAG